HDTAFVGREIDLALVKGIFDKALASNSVQFVTIAGEPGIGKSRLVAELSAYIDDLSELVTWRQGRCLPYGEGVTFWALEEIVKAHAGILDSDTTEVAATKLDVVLPTGEEQAWFRQRLLPLLGAESSSTAEREELFTAWRRFVESIAERDPTVLVFEDLHWADEAMLAFIEHLVGRAEGVPLLVVATARPELFEQHRSFGQGLRNSNSINLTPLTKQETSRLLSALLDSTLIPAEVQEAILDRAEGNPLYAEEYVRLLKDRSMLVRKGSSWELAPGAEIPFPDSVQALIAARLDTLAEDRKELLSDAAVVGKVFWAGALAAMGNRTEADVAEVLRELSRKELVRPARRSTMEGEAEYAFWHVLARDVAYSQLPRTTRVEKHVAAATWIESKAGERGEELAQVLAFHYVTALELARAAGQHDLRSLEEDALRFLILAGDRVLGLDTTAALTHFGRAMELTPIGHPARLELLVRLGKASHHARRLGEAVEALEEAVSGFNDRDDLISASRAMLALSNVLYHYGDPRGIELSAEALALLEPLPPGPELVAALTETARMRNFEGAPEDSVTYSGRAIELASRLGLPPPVRAIGCRGMARCDLGDPAGLEEMEEALFLAKDAGQAYEASVMYQNLGIERLYFEGPHSALPTFEDGAALAEARGLGELASGLGVGSLDALVDLGEFEQVLLTAPRLLAQAEAAGSIDVSQIWCMLIRVLVMRGEGGQAKSSLAALESSARENSRIADVYVSGLAAAALARHALGEGDLAAALLHELGDSRLTFASVLFPVYLPALTRMALEMGDVDGARMMLMSSVARWPYGEHSLVAATAAVSEAQGELAEAADGYGDAAARWESFGHVPERVFALLGRGRCLLRLGSKKEAVAALHLARSIFIDLGAAPSLREVDELLAQGTALSS
ncbi:MAG: ATP-binding protein, partial [Actinomycetota bacterium]